MKATLWSVLVLCVFLCAVSVGAVGVGTPAAGSRASGTPAAAAGITAAGDVGFRPETTLARNPPPSQATANVQLPPEIMVDRDRRDEGRNFIR